MREIAAKLYNEFQIAGVENPVKIEIQFADKHDAERFRGKLFSELQDIAFAKLQWQDFIKFTLNGIEWNTKP